MTVSPLSTHRIYSDVAPAFRLGQRPCLDGLRGLAVLSVLLTHCGLLNGGVVGVEVLFTLSGFLITAMLIEESNKTGRISLSRFFHKRFLRVIPPLMVMIVVGSLVGYAIGFQTIKGAVVESLAAMTFTSNLQPFFLFRCRRSVTRGRWR